MRPEKLYLLDIVEAAEAIGRFCGPVGEDEFLQDELHQSAVLQKLIVIGEAAARLPGDFQKKHKEIEWEDIVSFRNIAVHEYFAVLWQIVWNTAVQDVPDLRMRLSPFQAIRKASIKIKQRRCVADDFRDQHPHFQRLSRP